MPANNSENKKDNLANKNSADQDSSRYQANKADKANKANKKNNRQGNNSQNTQGSNAAKDKIKEAGKKVAKKGLEAAGNAVAPGLGTAINKGQEALKKMPGIGQKNNNNDSNNFGGFNPFHRRNPMSDRGDREESGGEEADASSEDNLGSKMKLPGPIGGLPDFLGRRRKRSQEGDSSALFNGVLSIQKMIAIGFFAMFGGAFFLIIMFLVLAGGSGVLSNYDDALGVSSASGGELGEIDYETSDKDAQAFFERVADVKNSFQSQGKSFDPVYISAIFSVLNRNGAKLDYTDMTDGVITEFANAMFSGNSFNEDTFRENLKSTIFPKYIPDVDTDDYESLVDEIFDYYESYLSLIDSTPSTCASLGSCVYEIKGFYTTRLGNVVNSMTISDLQVRLMQCGGQYGSGDWNTPLEGEELVPFEQYILGVAYQEIGPDAPDEAIKAQMVAARSFSLVRPTVMGNENGKKLEQENGQWILQLSACVADQVYCNPELGCSAMNDGEQYGTVRSGTDQAVKLKDPLPADHKMRTLANETMGEILVNEQGNVVYADYASKIQNQFKSLANEGLNYKQILLQVYGNSGATDIDKMSCNTGNGSGCATTGSTGPYSGWKQSDANWASISLGNSSQTIGSAGCLATSVSMLIAKSGAATTLGASFNPGTFVETLNSHNGFSGALFNWDVSSVTSNFQLVNNNVSLEGQSREQKLSTITNLVNQGYYVVAEVKGGTGEHWVAIDSVDGSNVYMMDPGSQSTNMWEQYDWHNTSRLAYFRVV